MPPAAARVGTTRNDYRRPRRSSSDSREFRPPLRGLGRWHLLCSMIERTAVEDHDEPKSEDWIMRKSTQRTVAVALLAGVVAGAPVAASAADSMDKAADKAKSVTEGAKTTITDSWLTSKTKIALFADD